MCKVLEVGDFKFFDTLYQRYGDPIPLLDQMAASGHLSWFVGNLIDAHCKEENDRFLWETWLHKVWNMEWKDYRKRVMTRARNEIKNEYVRTHPQETAKTVAKSQAIIDLFSKPVEKN